MKSKPVWKKLYYPEQNLKYEGYTVNDKPYGEGTAYYPEGTVYQEGIFDQKGLVKGKEYYPNGVVRFEGEYAINSGYGPNYPIYGKCYDESRKIYYYGKLSIWKSGLGYPRVSYPEQYGQIDAKWRPDIGYFMWEDKENLDSE